MALCATWDELLCMRSAAAALARAPVADAGCAAVRLECLPSAPCGADSLLAAGLGRSRPRTCAGATALHGT